MKNDSVGEAVREFQPKEWEIGSSEGGTVITRHYLGEMIERWLGSPLTRHQPLPYYPPMRPTQNTHFARGSFLSQNHKAKAKAP